MADTNATTQEGFQRNTRQPSPPKSPPKNGNGSQHSPGEGMDVDNLKSHLNPRRMMDIAKKMSMKVSRTDALNEDDEKKFLTLAHKFCVEEVFKTEPNEEQFVAFMTSLYASAVNQSTSSRVANNTDAQSRFNLDGHDYVYSLSKFWRYIRDEFGQVNAFRRFCRLKEDDIRTLIQSHVIVQSGQIPSKHGTAAEFKSFVGDWMTGASNAFSQDELAAATADRRYALRSTGPQATKTIYNVNQLIGD